MRWAWLALDAAALCAPALCAQSIPSDSGTCASCHAGIVESYRRTGMARSFFRPAQGNTIEDYSNKNSYYHAASDIRFEMIRRDGKYFLRQYQIGFGGKTANVSETGVDFVLGSGNHARTYLHRTRDNRLVELPLGWYAENGGYWAMNPGYDRPDHQGLDRAIGYDCVFCHDAYPEIPEASGPRADPVYLSLGEGIDCARCHGDGGKHARLARTAGSNAEQIRGAIVNPARLAADRQMEVCMQCHLETTSFSTQNAIVRYERGPFSFKPGEKLSDFRLHFDRVSDKPEDRFEIAGGAYRLRLSQCFLKSKGTLTCVTCHDPHQTASAKSYLDACRKCHSTSLDRLVAARRHVDSTDCAGCHMPKRRTQDAVHIVMTDHLIQRKPAGNLLGALSEVQRPQYQGEIAFYYSDVSSRAEDDLYLGVAQVSEASARANGIARLTAGIARFRPDAAEFYLQLGDALRASGHSEQAIARYEEAVQREPRSVAALDRLALGLQRVQRYAESEAAFQKALALAPDRAETWAHLGTMQLEQRRAAEAVVSLEKSLAMDPDQAETRNTLGGARMQARDAVRGESEFREAIRLRPNYAEAHHNLANVLSPAGRFDEARYHFEAALRIRENHVPTRYDYAVMLVRWQHRDEARRQLETLLRFEPKNSEAQKLLKTLR